ncbi:MAG: hypothetical protein ACFHVJ_14745 [Aestuariibacter sp.]
MSLAFEVFYMSLFIFACGFCLHCIGYVRELADENYALQTKLLRKLVKGRKLNYRTGNSVFDKWMDFGGGYYGTMAFIQFIFIELEQIRDFLADFPGVNEFIQSLGIGTIINFFVEQIMNFVAAIIWPVEYLERYDLTQMAILIGFTYLAYEVSRKLAKVGVYKMLND